MGFSGGGASALWSGVGNWRLPSAAEAAVTSDEDQYRTRYDAGGSASADGIAGCLRPAGRNAGADEGTNEGGDGPFRSRSNAEGMDAAGRAGSRAIPEVSLG